MASIQWPVPFNFPIQPLPSDGSVDTSYFIQVSKEELIWLAWKVKEFTVSGSFSGWPADAFITSGSFDPFAVGRHPESGTIICEKSLQFVRQWFENRSTKYLDPPPNPYGFSNWQDLHVAWDLKQPTGPRYDYGTNVYHDRALDCFWIHPPEMEMGAFVEYGGNPVVLHAASDPSETASQTHVGDLTVSLFGRTTTVPLISTDPQPGSFAVTWPSGATASASMEIGTLYPYTSDQNDF